MNIKESKEMEMVRNIKNKKSAAYAKMSFAEIKREQEKSALEVEKRLAKPFVYSGRSKKVG